DIAVERLGRLHRLAAAIPDKQTSIENELIAFGMAAKIIVVVEDQDSRISAHSSAKKPRCRKPADTATDNEQIVFFLDWQPINGIAVVWLNDFVSNFKRARMLTTQSGQRRRITRRIC